MIQYIRRFPATYARFCGWVYTTYQHTPSYLEFTKPELTYRLLREFFGAPVMIPPHLTTAEQLYDDARPILEKYEHTITGGKKAEPIMANSLPPVINDLPLMTQDIISPANDLEGYIYDENFWNNPANFPGPDPPF